MTSGFEKTYLEFHQYSLGKVLKIGFEYLAHLFRQGLTQVEFM